MTSQWKESDSKYPHIFTRNRYAGIGMKEKMCNRDGFEK